MTRPAACTRRRLLILRVGARVADVRIGQGDDLAQVGGVGQDLLVARHGSIEHHLTDAQTGRADGLPPEDRAVFQDQDCGIAQGSLRFDPRLTGRPGDTPQARGGRPAGGCAAG